MPVPNSPQPQSPQELAPVTIREIFLRYGVYTIAIFLLVLGIWGLSKVYGTRLFGEGSPLEWIQLGLLLASTGLNILVSRRITAFRGLMILLALLPGLASIRELDAYFDSLLPAVGWQGPFVLVALFGGWLLWRNREGLASQIGVFIRSRAFGMMWCALVIVTPFGQMMGRGKFLSSLFGADFQRPYKRVIEESCESLGYVIILLASTEWALSLRRRAALRNEQQAMGASPGQASKKISRKPVLVYPAIERKS